MKRQLIRISKFLSYVLRHNPGAMGLHVDEEGWASVDDLMSCAARNGRNLTLTQQKDVVAANNKNRFSLSPQGHRIRANYGHSIEVELGLEPVTPPPVLYHGTAEQAIPSILKDGLKPSGRRYVHLSVDIKAAANVGKRHGDPVVLQVNSGGMNENGFIFYSPATGVWLVDCVPSEYLTRRNPGGIAQEIDSMERLFTIITGMMDSNGFESYYPGWHVSNAKMLGSPRMWLQYLTQRLYARDDFKRILNVNLSLKNEAGNNSMPFLTCGLIQVAAGRTGRSDEFSWAGWNIGQGVHIRDQRSPLILSLYRAEQTAIISYLVKYTESMDERDIRKSIVVPLLKMYELIPEIIDLASVDNAVRDAICAIPDYALTVEDIKGS